MADRKLSQIFTDNPVTEIGDDDIVYVSVDGSPDNEDAGILGSNLKAQIVALGTGVYDPAGTAATLTANAPVMCVWDDIEEEWETLAGAAVPTSDSLIRIYNSQNDADATAPTAYSVFDMWFGVEE